MLVVFLARTGVLSRDLDLADAVANEVALALDNAFLFERAVGRAANLETVFRISQAVGSSLQVNVVLNRVLDVVQKILSADAVALMTYDPRKRSISTAMARGAIPAEVLSMETHPGEDVPGYVFSTGEPAAFRDLDESMGGIAGRAAAHSLRSLLAVPLLARGRSIGVLMVFSADAGAFSDEDMNVLQTFASQAALALDTARLYSHEHEVASILQQSILPDALPEYPEIEAASAYQPAGADAEIGGDYYDLFRAPDGALWFAIARCLRQGSCGGDQDVDDQVLGARVRGGGVCAGGRAGRGQPVRLREPAMPATSSRFGSADSTRVPGRLSMQAAGIRPGLCVTPTGRLSAHCRPDPCLGR